MLLTSDVAGLNSSSQPCWSSCPMRPVRVIRHLYLVARKRNAYLRSLVPQYPVVACKPLDRRVAYVAIELMNCWAGFSRALYLSSCRGALDSRHRRITILQPLQTDEDAIRFASMRFNPRLTQLSKLTHRNEPAWLDPNVLITLLHDVGASNSGDVAAALSFQGRVLRDLPTIRNFYAHRAENTATKSRRLMVTYGLSSTNHPTEFCLAYESGRSQSVLLNWIDELTMIQELTVS